MVDRRSNPKREEDGTPTLQEVLGSTRTSFIHLPLLAPHTSQSFTTMATESTVVQAFARALWDPRPTKTHLQELQLAYALGYPEGWRVTRTKLRDGTLVDRIHADVDATWFHHEGALQAVKDGNYTTGHLMPRTAHFDKGDLVQVLYEDEWYDAKILRRKEYSHGFRYQVQYTVDRSKQSGVEEVNIRERVNDEKSPQQLAEDLGLSEEWEAYYKGKNKWRIVSPDGDVYTSKKAALEAFVDQPKEEGDPPWRTTGHEYLGRQVQWSTEYSVSARRKVQLDQTGTVVGWISATDVDTAGEPGFVSERTGQPANLFHVKFEDDPHHPYSKHLLQSQDLEEHELLEVIVGEVATDETVEDVEPVVETPVVEEQQAEAKPDEGPSVEREVEATEHVASNEETDEAEAMAIDSDEVKGPANEEEVGVKEEAQPADAAQNVADAGAASEAVEVEKAQPTPADANDEKAEPASTVMEVKEEPTEPASAPDLDDVEEPAAKKARLE